MLLQIYNLPPHKLRQMHIARQTVRKKWFPHTRPLGLITMELNKETNTLTFSPLSIKHAPPLPARLLPLSQGIPSTLAHRPSAFLAPASRTAAFAAPCPGTDDHTEPQAPRSDRGWSLFHHPTTREGSAPALNPDGC